MTRRVVCSCRAHGTFLTAKGLEEAAQRRAASREVDARELSLYLDKVGSVSAVRRDETTFWPDDEVLDEQHRRFLDDVALRSSSQEGSCAGSEAVA